MAIVIRNGKRYRFNIPIMAGRYTLTRYGPAPDKDGIINPKDLLIFVAGADVRGEIECDGADALQLDDAISAFSDGDITEEQFIERVDTWFAADLQ